VAKRKRESAQPQVAKRKRDSAQPQVAKRKRDSAQPQVMTAGYSSGKAVPATFPRIAKQVDGRSGGRLLRSCVSRHIQEQFETLSGSFLVETAVFSKVRPVALGLRVLASNSGKAHCPMRFL